ncbi:hypothetical protein CRF12_000529 [Salmonella enterica subsp. enterica serovar Glostrup]|uniref:Uncharacterized protein n=1 Tax=Salmonella enterica TaxID=28901 RepID=A0A760MLH7_SALER|nr:hypothetical protein [Salmonella enterica]ECR6163279.1 hypothetical protein [Salmonella enterica subsp. enterica serovar Muenchen]EDU7664503.1 hypothetical protein [Salmonella enterica subsp. enterica serovar Glostrup]EHC9818094.1 hypothetical protein [Salmonella enterica subsp. enterica serovar Newport]EAN5887131.1 hypothetical protein [Salmonella enterica]
MESMAEGMIKDLVASGHALADDMTGAPSVLIRCLAAQLEVQLVRANALAAENAGLKKFCKDAAFDADYEAELGMERGGFSDALNEIKTPATDAFLAEVRAQGVEMFSEKFGGGTLISDMVKEVAKDFAAQLRKGVQS